MALTDRGPVSEEDVMVTFGALKRQLYDARAEAKREARNEWEFPFIRDRRRRLIVTDERRERITEPADWRGTLREIREAAATPGAAEVLIQGGFDGSDTIHFDSYEPEVSVYEVVVWTRG